ncbi:MAG: hypothetical protein GY896_14585 [Gammaproteobacteria bacterium]|nr:hypothetical protein [Gammaproteobacteria bacterium]
MLIEIINQAVDEVEKLCTTTGFDEDFKGESNIIVAPVSEGPTRLLSAKYR